MISKIVEELEAQIAQLKKERDELKEQLATDRAARDFWYKRAENYVALDENE